MESFPEFYPLLIANVCVKSRVELYNRKIIYGIFVVEITLINKEG